MITICIDNRPTVKDGDDEVSHVLAIVGIAIIHCIEHAVQLACMKPFKIEQSRVISHYVHTNAYLHVQHDLYFIKWYLHKEPCNLC